jgi:mycoredoxin
MMSTMNDRPGSPPDAALHDPAIVVVYGTEWCIDCHVARRALHGAGIGYRYVDLDRDAAARRRVEAAGYRAVPVVALPDGSILVEPSATALLARVEPAS